ncbi:MAG: DUF1018 domain-containing protein [Deltaproteobacteria bacterium]|nr:DUF1018 domain-containing protein [Deltaproteobacteria bacterium]
MPTARMKMGEDAEGKQRRGLLAKIHIAKKELGMSDDQYEAILSGFGVESSKDLPLVKLEQLARYLEYLGWKPFRPRRRTNVEKQITALQDRAVELAGQIENGTARLAGLVKSIGKVDALPWLRDTRKLKQLLSVLQRIRDQESIHGNQIES